MRRRTPWILTEEYFSVRASVQQCQHSLAVVYLPMPIVACSGNTGNSRERAQCCDHGIVRLARTQNVIAIAKLSDGSLHKVSNHVDVTVGGCGSDA